MDSKIWSSYVNSFHRYPQNQNIIENTSSGGHVHYIFVLRVYLHHTYFLKVILKHLVNTYLLIQSNFISVSEERKKSCWHTALLLFILTRVPKHYSHITLRFVRPFIKFYMWKKWVNGRSFVPVAVTNLPFKIIPVFRECAFISAISMMS